MYIHQPDVYGFVGVYVGLGCQSNGCVYLILMHLLPQTQLMRITQATQEWTAESEMKFTWP